MPDRDDQKTLTKQWYVVHTYSGFESKVKATIEEKAKALGLQDKIAQILIPTADVVELRQGKRRETKKKFFPGYILVEMVLDDDTWHLIKDIPKVTGFVGGGPGTPPPSLTEEEVNQIRRQIDSGAVVPESKVQFQKGDRVRIADGPFTSFTGTVDEVNPDQKRLKVMVSIFGRPTPVELEFLQVEKA